MAQISSRYSITKASDQQTLYGWLNVSTLPDGTEVVDTDGQNIPIAELEKAAHKFLKGATRSSGVDHDGGATDGEMVSSIVMTEDVIDALSTDPSNGEPIADLRAMMKAHLPRGWFGAFHIADPDAWAEAKEMGRQAFSVEGEGRVR